MVKKITIDPITRLEGHGKIEIFLDDNQNVERAYLQIPELRGFEQFCVGRPAEEMPRLTPRICGVCPWAHHMVSAKALDDLWQVEIPTAGRKIRELLYNSFYIEDHSIHFYFLGTPDFVVGPTAPKAERNIVGVLNKVGLEIGKEVINARKMVRECNKLLGGRPSHAVCGLPGGVSKGIKEEERKLFIDAAENAVKFGEMTLQIFDDIVLKNPDYVKMILSDAFRHETYYAALVDSDNMANFYDGMIRVVDTEGKEFVKFEIHDYLEHIAEHVEPWSYMKFLFLKKLGWRGFKDGKDTSLYRVGPLARFNATEGYRTPKAAAAAERMKSVLGGKPVHATLTQHWARAIEILAAAERMLELANDPDITSPNFRTIPTKTPKEGIAVIEAPRGLLIHHYNSDEKGILTKANLIVATQHQMAAIVMSVDLAARSLIKNGVVNDGILNQIEMAFRPYDPCHGCGTHALPGEIPLIINIYDHTGALCNRICRQ